MTVTYTQLDSYRDDLGNAIDSAKSEFESLSSIIDDCEQALEFFEEYTCYFEDCPADVSQELEGWREAANRGDCADSYDLESALSELEDYRELGDIDDVREAVENGSPDRVDELEAEVERQAALITRLATALDDINTITTDELIGTGGA